MTSAPLWINILFSVGQFYGAATLVPMLMGERKPPIASSLMVVIPQPLYVYAYFSMGMYGAAGMASLLLAVWSVLLVQGFEQRGRDRK